MEYTITIGELIDRVQIRSDKSFEWENKMTNEELEQFESEVVKMCIDDGAEDTAVCYTSKIIDREILYKVFSLADEDQIAFRKSRNIKNGK
jgi:hypothetical protein